MSRPRRTEGIDVVKVNPQDVEIEPLENAGNILEVNLSKVIKEQEAETAPARAWLMGTAGWFIPGLGHLLQGKVVRALLLGGAVWACFLGGLWMGGHLFIVNGNEQGTSFLLQVPPMVANLGAGLLYVVSWFLGIGFADDPIHAARATYEYGNTFLLIAGLLNYLCMLDAFDISAGRKS